MNTLRLAAVACACSLAPLAFAQEQQIPYIDNRSDAAELVRSFYNAINRREYVRAWEYFSDKKPATDLQAFTDGYADTERVDVETGGISEEGAAGSVYYSLPVAIKATGKDGSEKVFAGCYTARLANPQIQDTTFAPMRIESGSLSPTETDLGEALPESCGDGPQPSQKNSLLEKVKKRFAADYSGLCQTLEPGAEAGSAEPTDNTIGFRYKSDAEDDPERQAHLFRFQCGWGAYNTTEVYYFADEGGDLQQLQFATPELDIHYENNDFEGKVEAVNIIGYTAADQLVNSEYSTETKSIESFNKWRGIGDASSIGRWIFRDGSFTLVKYEVDASYDGEINPETVLDYDTAP
jgi:Protein of unknown function (DUF1176)